MDLSLLDLPEDLQARIISSASEYEGGPLSDCIGRVQNLFRCSLACKYWRDLVRNQCNWPRLTVYLFLPKRTPYYIVTTTKEATSPDNQAFLQYFERRWDGLESLKIARTSSRSRNQPVLTPEQLAQVLPQARQLKEIEFPYNMEVDEVGQEALKWLAKANHVEDISLLFGDDETQTNFNYLPESLEKAVLSQHAACSTIPSFNRLAELKNLKVLELDLSEKHQTGIEDLAPIGLLENLTELEISGAWLINVPLWVSHLRGLETLSLGTLVVPFSTIPSTIGLHRLTNIPTVKKLVFEGMLPADVSALNQLLSACLVSNKVCVDLSGLELCGPRLETVHVLSTRGAEDGFATISGLSTLRGLKKCRILGDEKFCDVCVVFDKGWGSIEFFEIFTDGRLLVKGEKEAFAQFWEKMSIFKLRYGVFPPDDLTDPHQPEIEMMLAAGRARGLDLRGHQTFVDQTHPVLGRGARCHFNIYPYN